MMDVFCMHELILSLVRVIAVISDREGERETTMTNFSLKHLIC